MASEVKAADDDATCQEAAPGRHEVDGEPKDFRLLWGILRSPNRLSAGQAEHGALRAARGRELVPGLGQRALPQGDVLWAPWHDFLADCMEAMWNKNQSGREDVSFSYTRKLLTIL